MKSISQTKFLSENYSALHGLNAVPVGLALFLVSLWANTVQYPIRNFSLLIVLLLGCLLFAVGVDRYYKQTFGEIKPVLARRHRSWILQSLWGVLGIVAYWVDVTLNLPISFIGLLFAAMFLIDKPGVTFPLDKFSTVRLILSICIIFVSTAPLYLGKNWWEILGVRTTIIGVTMVIGALIVLQGVIWHIFFINSLPVPEAEDA